MPFNSAEFFLFFAGSALAYRIVPAFLRTRYILFISYIFYFFWSVPYAVLLAACTGAAYWGGRAIEVKGEAKAKPFLAAALAVLLGNFAFFKCLPLLKSGALGLLGGGSWVSIDWLAPIGLSYYTFKLVSYVFDVYWGKIKAESDWTALAAYATFFPQILSGPIQRADSFLGQLRAPVSDDAIVSGMRLVLYGLFKKLVIADNLVVLVDSVFDHHASYGAVPLWVASFCFYLQIYADFSGVTDIAIGTGKFFGIEAPPNFNAPYLARSVQEFWRRWHMTLSLWINDYLFLPVRAAWRGLGNAGLIASLWVSMIAIAAWHGVTSNFLAFGVVQGVYMSISALTLQPRDRFFKKHPALAAIRRFVAPCLTFTLITLSFIFFKARSFSQGTEIFRGLFKGPFVFDRLQMGLNGKEIALLVFALAAVDVLERGETITDARFRLSAKPAWFRWSIYYALVFILLGFGRFVSHEFIYFKF